MNSLLAAYQALLVEHDEWFFRQQQRCPGQIVCAAGCSGCCRGLFDITLLDAALLQHGVQSLSAPEQQELCQSAAERLAGLQLLWPGFSHPYILNLLPDALWSDFPEDDETPCLFLAADGRCRLYRFRPLTCRLHGLPQIDLDGEVHLDNVCTRNYAGFDPFADPALRRDLQSLYRREFALQQAFAEDLCGVPLTELDTLIPAAVLIDLSGFDWRGWAQTHQGPLTRFR